MPTRDELLAKAFPAQIERIRTLAGPAILREATNSAANELATVFDWAETAEGWNYWSDLYEKA